MANFFRIGSAGLNWSNVGSWSTTSGGASNGVAQPTSSDNTTFDTNSPATVTVAGAAACNTLTLNKASLVITLNGGSIVASGATTITLAATINKTAAETFSATGISHNTTGQLSGTAKTILIGGTWTLTGGTTGIATDLDIQGNVTISSTVRYYGGTFTYVSGTVTTTSSTVRIESASTLNLNGITFNNITILSNSTLTSNLSCTGVLNVSAQVTATTAETMTSSGGFTNGGTTSGTAKIILTGGTFTSGGIMTSNLDLQGNITIASGTQRYGAGGGASTGGKTLTYVSGTITCTGALGITGICTLNTNGMTWGAITPISGTGGAITLTSNLSLSGVLQNSATSLVINKTTSETVTASGGVTIGASASLSGTASIYLTGGSWTGIAGTPGSTSFISSTLFIQGNVTVVNNVRIDSNTITYVSGTVTTTGSTLFVRNAETFDTNGMTWNNINFDNNSTNYTITINSLLSISGTLTLSTGGITFAGTSGFTTATLTSVSTAANTITLKNSITYTVTTSLSCFTSQTSASLLFTSDDGTIKAILTLQNPAACDCLANFTRIDASGGRTINTFNGIITSCTNIREFHDFQTIGG